MYDVCQDLGSIDRVYVEQGSEGSVWIKFKGSSPTKSAEKTVGELNGRYFDNRLLSAMFVTEIEFMDKIRER